MSQGNYYTQFKSLPGDNLFFDFMNKQFGTVVTTMKSVAEQMDEYYSLYFLMPKVQMVLGGLKPVTTFQVDRGLLDRYKAEGLTGEFDSVKLAKILFETSGLRLDEFGFNQDERIINFYLYSPEHVALVQQEFFPAEKYFGQNLNTYLKHVTQKGIRLDRLQGYLSGFPSSAVDQYIINHSATHCVINQRQLVAGYGESYMIWGEAMPRDVELREQVKQYFFNSLLLNSGYNALMDQFEQRAVVFRDLSLSSLEQLITHTR